MPRSRRPAAYRAGPADAARRRGGGRGPAVAHGSAAHGPRVEPAAVESFVAELRAAGVHVLVASDDDDARRRVSAAEPSFSVQSHPKASLKGVVADIVLAASEADVLAASAAAVKHGVPLTPRGAGTGNYGQAMPLRGGAVLDVSALDAIEHIDAEAGTVAGAGAKLGHRGRGAPPRLGLRQHRRRGAPPPSAASSAAARRGTARSSTAGCRRTARCSGCAW